MTVVSWFYSGVLCAGGEFFPGRAKFRVSPGAHAGAAAGLQVFLPDGPRLRGGNILVTLGTGTARQGATRDMWSKLQGGILP